jgi:hypothetical protein
MVPSLEKDIVFDPVILWTSHAGWEVGERFSSLSSFYQTEVILSRNISLIEAPHMDNSIDSTLPSIKKACRNTLLIDNLFLT